MQMMMHEYKTVNFLPHLFRKNKHVKIAVIVCKGEINIVMKSKVMISLCASSKKRNMILFMRHLHIKKIQVFSAVFGQEDWNRLVVSQFVVFKV